MLATGSLRCLSSLSCHRWYVSVASGTLASITARWASEMPPSEATQGRIVPNRDCSAARRKQASSSNNIGVGRVHVAVKESPALALWPSLPVLEDTVRRVDGCFPATRWRVSTTVRSAGTGRPWARPRRFALDRFEAPSEFGDRVFALERRRGLLMRKPQSRRRATDAAALVPLDRTNLAAPSSFEDRLIISCSHPMQSWPNPHQGVQHRVADTVDVHGDQARLRHVGRLVDLFPTLGCGCSIPHERADFRYVP